MDKMSLPTAEELKEIEKTRGKRRALDVLYKAVDIASEAEKSPWPTLDNWLTNMDPEDLSMQMLIGTLTITIRKMKLPWRKDWAKRAEREVWIREVDNPKRAERLLRNLI
jgi:hypothetical protein